MATKGYTLIEIMVAVGVFTVIMAAPTGFFVSSIKSQQKALSSQELLDNISYTLEYMSRALRMAKKDLTGNCIGQNLNYALTRDGKGIAFKNYENVCQEFFWDATQKSLKEARGAEVVSLTGGDLEVISFKLGPTDSWDQNDNSQPFVTLFISVKGIKSQRPELQPLINIQTSISQRNLDVTY